MIVKFYFEKLFGVNIYFVTDCSHKELENFVREKHHGQFIVHDLERECRNFIPDVGAYAKAFRSVDPNGESGNRFWLWMTPKWDGKDNWNFSLLVHENTHLVGEILRFVGVQFHSSSEEVYAYLAQHLINEFFERHPVSKIKKKVNKKKGKK